MWRGKQVLNFNQSKFISKIISARLKDLYLSLDDFVRVTLKGKLSELSFAIISVTTSTLWPNAVNSLANIFVKIS